MPRSHRPRRGGRAADPRARRQDEDEEHLQRAIHGTARQENRRGALWMVQSVSGASSSKSYVCPGCGLEVPPGQPHTVAWRADGVLGASADLAARRHWHTHCWKVS